MSAAPSTVTDFIAFRLGEGVQREAEDAVTASPLSEATANLSGRRRDLSAPLSYADSAAPVAAEDARSVMPPRPKPKQGPPQALGRGAAGQSPLRDRRLGADALRRRKSPTSPAPAPQIAVVIGGGNLFRGVAISAKGGDRVTGDHMGMLATVMNALALEAALSRQGMEARALSAIEMPSICETYVHRRAAWHMSRQVIIVLAGGTGNPFFTTDSGAALRALELECDALLKGTQVDGVYSADPRRDPKAVRYDHVTFQEAISQGLAVMDTAAFALARDNGLPIIVFNVHEAGRLGANRGGGGGRHAGFRRLSGRAPGPRRDWDDAMEQGLDFKDLSRRMHGAVSVLKTELSGLRTGRASPNLLDPVMVSAYGTQMPINQVATINVPEPRMLSVQVWDKGLAPAVDRAIRDANLGSIRSWKAHCSAFRFRS